MSPDNFEQQKLSPEQETIAELRRQLAEKEQKIIEQREKLLDRDKKIATLNEIINTDKLTQLRSPGAVREKISSIDERRQEGREGAAESEAKKRVAALMLDIDRFKSINDTYGHRAGDEVLKQAGKFLADKFRKSDFLGRWGGEEFLALLKVPDLDLFMNKFYDPESGQARLGFEAEVDGKKIPITFSGGVAMLEPGEKLEDATERADQALYAAKNESEGENGEKIPGRNRILPYAEIKKEPKSELAEDLSLDRDQA